MESTMTVEKSTHKVEVLEIKEIRTHPNADKLGLVDIYDYSSCVQLSAWKVGDLAAWVPPDSEVDVSRPEFAFLAPKAKDGKVRIRTEKLRGYVSYGLLVPAPAGSKVGDNIADKLGVEHWQPAIEASHFLTGGEATKPPSGIYPKYDVDAFLKWGRMVYIDGEQVAVTEKIHGASSKYLFKDGELFCGSRDEWKREYPTKPTATMEELIAHFKTGKEPEKAQEKAERAMVKIQNWQPKKNLWWIVLENTPAIREFCVANPNHTLYGEAYGMVKGWDFGCKGKHTFACFDILKPDGTWMDFPDFLATCNKYEIPHVPVIEENMAFDFDKLIVMANRNSQMRDFTHHIAEGIVVTPVKERWDERVGRVKLKIINPNY